jgi:hypothetical protein
MNSPADPSASRAAEAPQSFTRRSGVTGLAEELFTSANVERS